MLRNDIVQCKEVVVAFAGTPICADQPMKNVMPLNPYCAARSPGRVS